LIWSSVGPTNYVARLFVFEYDVSVINIHAIEEKEIRL
jgi:hypothetical protein